MNSKSNEFIFTSDLDGTLIYSQRYLDEQTLPTLCVEEYQEKPLSFMTIKAIDDLIILNRLIHFIPTTSRTQSQLERIRLPEHQYDLVENGMRLLVDGVEDLSWHTERVKECKTKGIPKEEVAEKLSKIILDFSKNNNLDNYIRFLASGTFIFIKGSAFDNPQILFEQIISSVKKIGRKTDVQGSKLYVYHPLADKSVAALKLKEKLKAKVLITAGNAETDSELVKSGDMGFIPNNALLKLQGESITTTRNEGVGAGEEIIASVLSKIKWKGGD